MSAATCKGCGSPIQWALLNGKPHPFDIAPSGKDRGYEIVELGDDKTVAVYVSSAQAQLKKGQKAVLVVSHFATCSHAAQFRAAGGR
jgi:hypothetical protein